jgi:acetyl-CoA acyltransferase 1
MHRVNRLAAHLNPSTAPSAGSGEVFMVPTSAGGHPDDVVICSAVRTPICKAKRGAFKDTAPDILLAAAMKGAIDRAGCSPAAIQDIVIGNVLLQQAPIHMRMAQKLAGIPYSVALHGINRQCSSGIQAVATVANAIKAGEYECGLAGGVESMSCVDMTKSINIGCISQQALASDETRVCLMPMGITSENVAEAYGITRETQDKMAVESHAKACKAKSLGLYDEEIVPVTTVVKDKDGNEKTVTVTADEGMRPNMSLADLGKLKPAFKKGGTTTAGNSSQVSDGAACVLLASRAFAQKNGMPIIAIFRSFAVCGVPPEVMGIGPAFAIPLALKKAGLTVDDIDVFEVNEAFASQATYSVDKLGIPYSKLNPKGGAIALGHPLGATGSRQMATLLPELKRTNGKYGVISMCIGSGMGAAAVIEKV